MKYFKRKDGYVFGKVDFISNEIEEGFFEKGYVRCDADGNELKPKPKLKSKKK